MNPKRYKAECEVFHMKGLSPEMAQFYDLGTAKAHLEMFARTNDGTLYKMYFDLKTFPEFVPDVHVTRVLSDGKTEALTDSHGTSLDGCSAEMHTLTSLKEGWTRICHYNPRLWTPNVSLYKIYVKVCIWLNVYEASRKNGNTIDHYLPHQG